MTQQELFSHVTYDPVTGIMTRLSTRSNAATITANTSVRINNVNYSGAKLAWLYVTGAFPTYDLFTVDGTSDLRFANLAESYSLQDVEVTQAFLHKYFTYDPDTGHLTYRLRFSKSTPLGCVAGSVQGTLPNAGYVVITILGKNYPAHRLIWCYVHGQFPDKQIDHIDHDRTNNRISNLRLADNHTNMKNKSLYVTNTTGYSGVTSHGDNWKARIGVNGTKVLLGVFTTFNEAVAARKAAEKLLNYHKNHGLLKA